METSVNRYLAALNPAGAHAIVVEVSEWAGNNANSHANVVAASPARQAQMYAAVSDLLVPGKESGGIEALCSLAGISLVIASKIFRFCAPKQGAAVDRHASYFFNSLQVIGRGAATHFAREWANGRHTSSRLAVYTAANYARNKAEYFEVYLPTLASVAQAMHASQTPYRCAAQNLRKNWTPADVEMAAYYWWACHGAR
jgi:hypothetical protein